MLNALVILSAEAEHSDPAIPAVAVGAIVLGLMLLLLFAVVSFGGGREHS